MGKTQITVRIPDELVAFTDEQATGGLSRADVIARALRRERRRVIAERDAAIYAAAGGDADADALAQYAVRLPLDID